MVKVTDKDYYMDGYLQSNLDFCVERHNKKWDNLLIIDGMERSGKSTLARQIGYYLAYKRGVPFSEKNIFFDADSMMKFAEENRKQVIIWDEGAFEGMAQDWQNKQQQKLVKFLMTAAKYYHDYIFIIQKISKYNSYIAESRSLALIRVYAKDMIDKGYFKSYSHEQKNIVARIERKNLSSKKIRPDFFGRFGDEPQPALIDVEKYEKAKDKAIKNLLSGDDEKKPQREKILMAKLRESGMSAHEIAKLCGIGTRYTTQLIREGKEEAKDIA